MVGNRLCRVPALGAGLVAVGLVALVVQDGARLPGRGYARRLRERHARAVCLTSGVCPASLTR